MPIAPIWAFGAIIIWQIVALICASLVPPTWRLAALGVGYIVATPLIYRVDAKLMKTAIARRWNRAPLAWYALAFLAGIGFTIVGSELGNIGHKLSAETLPIVQTPKIPSQKIVEALLGSVIYPMTFVLVLVGVSLRALLTWITPWGAMVLASGLATFGGPSSQIAQLGFLAGLPIWLYTRTGSMSLAIVSYLPTTSMPALSLIGLSPGIEGFDLVTPGVPQEHPLWFTIVGALAILGGLGPIVHLLSSSSGEV